jgi:hypothetical protein
MFNKQFFAKAAGWIGGLISAGAASGSFGKYGALAAVAGSLLTGLGIHQASNTSADNPSGQK